MWRCLLFASLAVAALGEDLPRGQVIDSVKTAADPAQTYALYLPANYSASRQWNVILAFDAGARGRTAVDRLQAGAEKYGYIVAASNVSRNGPWAPSLAAADAMFTDVTSRFAVNLKRIYTAGQSGGARVAMRVAMDSGKIAGVIASSAGFPDGDTESKAPCPVFGTAGTEDFNYLEMRRLDQALETPHRVVVFSGGHTWLPSELAVQAIEWMEIQAMQSGLRPRDEGLLKHSFETRLAAADALQSELWKWRELKSLLADFQGLLDVAPIAARADALKQKPEVKDEFTREVAAHDGEEQEAFQYSLLQLRMGEDKINRDAAFQTLREKVARLAAQSSAPNDTDERRLARRLVATFLTGARGVSDPEFQDLIKVLRPPQSPPAQR